jgi:conjugal transfer pilus assembly protein TraE
MSENFIYLRLNTTPETVKFNHKRLLSFVGSAQYKVFNEQLEKESKLIAQEAISSHFDIESIHPNAHKLSCEISGVLKRVVGGRELKDEHITYSLQFRYNQGALQITQFTKSEVRYDA